jgi:hypothetical protein
MKYRKLIAVYAAPTPPFLYAHIIATMMTTALSSRVFSALASQ